MAFRACGPPASLGSSSRKPLVLGILEKGHDVRVWTDRVRNVHEGQPHLRRDVVGDGLREGVRGVLLSQPRLQLVVEPPGCLHRRHEHLMALRIEQEASQLLHVRQDEVEQRRSGFRPDLALQGGDGSLAVPDQLGDDGRIGFDRLGRASGRRPGGTLVREGRDEAVALEDGLQGVSEQRVGSADDFEEARAARRRRRGLG